MPELSDELREKIRLDMFGAGYDRVIRSDFFPFGLNTELDEQEYIKIEYYKYN